MKNKKKWYSMFLVSSILATTISTPVYAVSEVGKIVEGEINTTTDESAETNIELDKSLLPESKEKNETDSTIPETTNEVINEEENIKTEPSKEVDNQVKDNLNKEEISSPEKKISESEETLEKQKNSPSEDIKGPSIDLSSLEISQKEAKIGDVIKVSLRAEDESTVNYININYISSLSGRYETLELKLNAKSDTFESKLVVDKYIESGLWEIDSIEAYDLLNNSTVIYNTQTSENGNKDLSSGDFVVTGGKEDVTSPTIDITSLKISQSEAKTGEKIKFSIKAEDDSGIEYMYVDYVSKISGEYVNFALKYNKKTNEFETTIEIDKYMASGLWQLDNISVYDNFNNVTQIYNNQVNDVGDVNLSKGDFTVIGGKEDIVGPKIDLASLNVSQNKATIGETVNLSLKAEDENGVDYIYANYVSKVSGEYENFMLKYNKKSGKFETNIEITKFVASGLWKLESIEAYDSLNNSTFMMSNELNDSGEANLSSGDFTVTGGKEDITGPTIDASSLKISQKEAKVGDTITLSLKAKDENGIDYIYVNYVSQLSGNQQSFSMEYDKESGKFESEIVLDKYMEDGIWQIDCIEAYDSLNNSTLIYNNQTNYDESEDLSAGTFNLIGGKKDITGPIIDVTSLKISQKEAKVGDIVKISIKAQDENGVDGMNISYFSPISENYESSSLKLNEKSGFFELEIEVDKYMESGLWKIDSIEASDGLYNSSWIANDQLSNDGDEYLSVGDFKVIGGKVDVTPPSIDETSLTINKKKATVGEEIKVRVKAEDKDGITGMYINYEKPISTQNYRLKLTYNKNTGFYEGTIKIDKTVESGKWKVVSVQAYDNNNNLNSLYNDVYNEYYNGADLNAAEFTIYGASEVSSPSTYEVSDISVSLDKAIIGDLIKISLQLPTEVKITDAYVFYTSAHSNQPIEIELKYNKNTKYFEGYYEVTKDSELGLWEMESILYGDMLDNYIYIPSSVTDPKDGLDLSNGNFKIIDGVALQSISMNKKSLTLKKNSSEVLKVEYTPSNATVNKQISWSSSDTKIATVNEKGEVKAINPGIAVITANVNDKTTTSTITVSAPSVSYSTHVQSYGWMTAAKDGKLAGTEGKKKRMEAIKISIENNSDLGITYSTHVQKNSWMNWFSDGVLSGTSGEAKRLEAIKIKLTGKDAENYDVYYRVHAEKNGWLGWAKNGQEAGTEGFGRRLEAIEIVVVEKGAAAPGSITSTFIKKEKVPTISYSTHVQSIGWQSWVNDGTMAGTSGKAKRLEGIKIKLEDLPYTGNVQYKTHVQSYGWQGWSTKGALSGTSGKAKRLEAIQIQLTGEMAKKYDIYYRVHVQKNGWLGWAKNGESSGTEGKAKRLEGIEIKLVKKGEKAPSSKVKSFIK